MKNINNLIRLIFLSLVMTLSFANVSFAEETTTEKAKHLKNKSVDSVKGAYRNAEDQICETINGKVECVPQKLENKARNVKDKTETKIKKEKNKLD